MATTNIGYSNSIVTFANGANALAGQGEQYSFTLALPSNGGEDTILLTDSATGFQTQVGFGNVTGINFTYVTAFNNKVYGLAGPTVYVSALNDPTTWNNPNGVGNGFVTLNNWYATPVSLYAVVPYQGRLAFFARQTAQIFIIDPNLQNWQQQQILTNIGAVSALPVQSLGDLDVIFLSDTGFRSLRVRDMSLNAYVSDLGSPIDSLVQTALLAGNYANACGIVEPQANRYWCFLNGLIYVLSYFPASKIQAWSTYSATYANASNVQTAFTPQKFVVFNGQVYARDAVAFYLYGGSNNNTYDNSVMSGTTSWLDCKKPAVRKQSKGFDAAFQGTFTFQMSMDQASETMDTVATGVTNPTFQHGSYSYSADGYHIRFGFATTGSTYARLSSLIFRYDEGDEK